MEIPENYIEFLYWLKERSEKFWCEMPAPNKEEPTVDDWIYRAKWLPLTEDQIDSLEKKYAIKFTIEHREFLKILHAVDKIRPSDVYDKDGELIVSFAPYFHHWLRDKEQVERYLDWPYDTIFSDIKHGDWVKSWGERPQSEQTLEKVFANWYHKAPRLLPILAHRFVISEFDNAQNPILSVWGLDTIVYGWNMRHYLLKEIEEYLDLPYEQVYDSEDDAWYTECTLLKNINKDEKEKAKEKKIPYWNEILESN